MGGFHWLECSRGHRKQKPESRPAHQRHQLTIVNASIPARAIMSDVLVANGRRAGLNWSGGPVERERAFTASWAECAALEGNESAGQCFPQHSMACQACNVKRPSLPIPAD